MLNKHLIILLTISFFFAIPQASYNTALSSNQVGDLIIEIEGFQNDHGVVRIGLENSKKSYKNRKNTFKSAVGKIYKRRAICIFENLIFGEYAVRLYHDENENKKIDFTFYGYPKEKFGFSNNAKAVFGPPRYEKVKFTLDSKQKTIHINLQ